MVPADDAPDDKGQRDGPKVPRVAARTGVVALDPQRAVLQRHYPFHEVTVRLNRVPQCDDVADGDLVGLSDDDTITRRELGHHR